MGGQVGGLFKGGRVGQDEGVVDGPKGDGARELAGRSVGEPVRWLVGDDDDVVGQGTAVEGDSAALEQGGDGGDGRGCDGQPLSVGPLVEPPGRRSDPLPPVYGEHAGHGPRPTGEGVGVGERMGGECKRDERLEREDGILVDW